MRAVLLLVLLLSAGHGNASTVVRSACEQDYPPFCFVSDFDFDFDSDSSYADGFSVELMSAALAAMDYEATYSVGPWASVKGWLEDGSMDCLPLVGRTPEREPLFDFTFPYMTLHGAVVVRSDCDSIRSADDLSGLTIGVMSGDNAEEFMQRSDYGAVLVSTPSFEDALLLLSEGTVDAVVVQRLVGLKLIDEMDLASVKVLDWPLTDFRQDFCFAVKKGNSALLAVLNEGLAVVMADGTYQHLYAKWFAHMEIPSSRRIIVGGDRNFPPFEYLDSLGNPAGINVDLIRLTAAEVGLDVDVRLGDWSTVRDGLASGEIDVLCGMFYSLERDLEFEFTQPHTTVHYVSVVRSGAAPSSVLSLSGLSVAVQRGDIANDYLVENGFEGELLLYPSQEDALAAVVEGRCDCAIVARMSAAYWTKKENWSLVVGSTPFLSPEYCFAVRNGKRALLAELSEGLRVVVDTGGYHRVLEKWMSVYLEEIPLSFSVILRRSLIVLIPLAFILLWWAVWLRLLKRQVRRRTSELQRSEGLLNASQEILKLGGWEYDVQAEKIYWSRETWRIHGMEPFNNNGDPEGSISSSLECYFPEDRARVAEAFQNCVTTGEPYRMECRFKSVDGVEKWIRTVGQAVVESGSIVRVSGYIQDITEERKALEAVLYKDSLLSAMGRIALVGGWEFDPVTGQGTWTDEVAIIHGLLPAQNISLRDVLRLYLPESRERFTGAIREARVSGKEYDLELRLVTLSGENKCIRTIGQPVFEKGAVVRLRSSLQDITAIRESREKITHLNLVLQAIRQINQLIVRETESSVLIEKASVLLVEHRSYRYAMIVLVDSEGIPVVWKKAAAENSLTGREEILSGGELLLCMKNTPRANTCVQIDRNIICTSCPIGPEAKNTVTLLAPLSHAGTLLGFLFVSLQKGAESHEEEKSLLAEMASDIAFALSGIRDKEARLVAESDRSDLQKQLLQSQKMEAIGQLAGGIAHDFNNMLQVILGHARMLEESSQLPSVSITGILEAGQRASKLTRQLLLFSRRQVMNLHTLDLNSLIENLLRMIERLIRENIRLEWLPGSGVGSVHADAGMLEQVVMNLCINARDAMLSGGVLTIETTNVVIDSAYCATCSWARPGRFVLLSVTDTGVGMDKGTMERVFEPFFTTKEEGKGTGIGLATVYGIVKQHDGMVNVYSEPGKGSLFKVYLPMTEQKAEKVGVHLEGAAVGGTETILLAEDDSLVRELAQEMLIRGGYTVLTAVDGEEAVSVFKSNPDVDLLILDVIMPRLGGHKALERIRAIRPDIPALFSSGYSENAIHTNFVLHEGLSLLQKPYSYEVLLRAVRKALD